FFCDGERQGPTFAQAVDDEVDAVFDALESSAAPEPSEPSPAPAPSPPPEEPTPLDPPEKPFDDEVPF
ncbi:unnamed protein product, partial [marine sediment metagenome]